MWNDGSIEKQVLVIRGEEMNTQTISVFFPSCTLGTLRLPALLKVKDPVLMNYSSGKFFDAFLRSGMYVNSLT